MDVLPGQIIQIYFYYEVFIKSEKGYRSVLFELKTELENIFYCFFRILNLIHGLHHNLLISSWAAYTVHRLNLFGFKDKDDCGVIK